MDFSEQLWMGNRCRGTESNRRHEDFQSSALPSELPRPLKSQYSTKKGDRKKLPRSTPKSEFSGNCGRGNWEGFERLHEGVELGPPTKTKRAEAAASALDRRYRKLSDKGLLLLRATPATVLVDTNRNLPRLCLFPLGHHQLQDAFVEGRGCIFDVHRVGKAKAAMELPIPAFQAVVP